MNVSHIFAANPLDRAPDRRSDVAWLQAQLQDPRGRFLPLRQLNAAVWTGEVPRLAWLERAVADGLGASDEAVLLGLLDGVPHFAVAVDASADHVAPEGIEFNDTRALGAVLPIPEASMLAQARSLLDWHASHRFCERCGGPTVAVDGGSRRACGACGARSYPHISPSMIVLVSRGEFCLLARRRRAPEHRYSCLAGYLEPGESIEDAVAREVLEESGVHVATVRYHSSQPWPFPATLMIGCFAEATSEAIIVDGVEIDEARWFTRDDVARALAREHPTLIVPDRIAIAHHLMRAWAQGEP